MHSKVSTNQDNQYTFSLILVDLDNVLILEYKALNTI